MISTTKLEKEDLLFRSRVCNTVKVAQKYADLWEETWQASDKLKEMTFCSASKGASAEAKRAQREAEAAYGRYISATKLYHADLYAHKVSVYRLLGSLRKRVRAGREFLEASRVAFDAFSRMEIDEDGSKGSSSDETLVISPKDEVNCSEMEIE